MIHVGDLECFCTADAHRGSNGCKNRHDGHFGMLCEHCSEHHAEEYEVTEKNDPTKVEVVEEQEVIPRDDPVVEEDVVASGSDIIVEKTAEETPEEHEKRLFKYCFKDAYEKRYGKL